MSKHGAALCSFLGPSMVPTVPLLFQPPQLQTHQLNTVSFKAGDFILAKKEAGWAGYPEPWLCQRQGVLLGQTWVARSPLCSLKFFLEHNSVPGGQRTIPFYRHRGCKAPLRQPNKQWCVAMVSLPTSLHVRLWPFTHPGLT